MSSVLAGTARRCMRVPRLIERPVLVKQLHISQPSSSIFIYRANTARKFINVAQARHASEDGDLLAFPCEPVSQTIPSISTQSLPRYSNVREGKFDELLQFVRDRTGRVKVVKAGQVRATAWLRLFQLASKAEHIDAVAELFPRWRESGKSFTPLDAEMFARRCEELECPLLALKVFGDHPKYGLPLSSFPAARTLLHSLYQKYPIENVVAAISLLGLNNLPPVTKDPASCAMLYAACLRSKNKHALFLGKDIRIALQSLLQETEPFSKPKEKFIRAHHSVKSDLWLVEALRDIKRTRSDQGRGSWWITEWIARGEGRALPLLAERRQQARAGKHIHDKSATRNAPQQVYA